MHSPQPGPHPRWRRAVIAGLLVLATIVIVGFVAGRDALSLSSEQVVTWVNQAPVAGPLVLALVMAAVVVLPLPTIPVTLAAGALFGPVYGSVYALTGALIGAVASFWIARVIGRDAIIRGIGGHAAFCGQCTDRTLFLVVLVSRLVPVVSFALVSYGAGITAMRTASFALATVIGAAPMTVIYVSLGTRLQLSPGWFVLAGSITVVVLIILPRYIERHNPFGLRRYLPHSHGIEREP